MTIETRPKSKSQQKLASASCLFDSRKSYLLEDEILIKLCTQLNRSDQVPSVLRAKKDALIASAARHNAADDMKSAAGDIYTKLRGLLDLRQAGSNVRVFLRDTMAPLVTPGTATYGRLKRDIFGE